MEEDKVIYSGLLCLPPAGKLLIKKTWQQKFCMLYKASKCGIERLEVYDNLDEAVQAKNVPSRIITLEKCIKIAKKSQTFFSVITKTATYEFSTTSEQYLNEWIAALQSVCFRDDVSVVASIVEDNDLYSPSGEGVFNVKLHSSEASVRCGLEPKYYTLILTSTAIQLRNNLDNKLLFTWPYCFIRRYGHKQGKFTFEAGRKCETGEGTFYLEHTNQQEIFRSIASKMKSMKKRLNEVPSGVLECGDNQLHAALSMEARTRSPLPPSPTTSTTLHDIDTSHLNSYSDHSERSFASPPLPRSNPTKLNLALESETSIKKIITSFESKATEEVRKQIPAKPPRKISAKKFSDYETVSKYDEVEYRNDAWKTLGTDNVDHTENIQNSKEELVDYVSWGRTRRPFIETKQASKIITNPSTPDDDSYDKLNFFGSSSKLNVTKSDYKQIAATSMNPHAPAPPSYNPYVEINADLEGVRLADDSHLGYAVIKKNSSKEPEHQYHNEVAYTIISKPKRV